MPNRPYFRNEANMKQIVDLEYRELEQTYSFDAFINQIMKKCFETENLQNTNLYVSVILTTPAVIKNINKEFRNIDQETDVLSFPMFEKEEIHHITEEEALGDIVISIDRVKQQAEEYGHSFERELAYMLVHGFYHLMGEDHMNEDEKKLMRQKEENVLAKLDMIRL